MRSVACRSRRLLAIAVGVAAALATQPAPASASLTLTSAKLDGATSITSPPGGVMQAKVSGKATGGDKWQSTGYRFGPSTHCADTGGGGGNGTVEFDVTAPGEPGTYNVGFTARGEDDCGGAQSDELVLTDGLRVTTPAPNPNLPPRCGITVMLVLDKSGSIESSHATEAVRNAARAFLTALSGTGSKVSITDFSTTAKQQIGYTTVTDDSIRDVFNPYLQNDYKPAGTTNWEDAFTKVKVANADRAQPTADLVVFITDGDPNTINKAGGGTERITPDGAVETLLPAQHEADAVKGQGSHVFAVGVGAAVTKPASARRLTAVSGFQQFPQTAFERADYTLVENFSDLAAALRQVAIALCRASVSITKLVDEGDGVYRPDSGWKFTADVSVEGGYRWVQPAPPPESGPVSEVTGDDGVETFQWKPTKENESTVTISEEVKPGYQFVDYDCVTNAPGRSRRKHSTADSGPVGTGTIGPNEYARCTVRNRILPGTIEIEKEANPQGPQEFPFTASLEPPAFSLVDEAGGESSSRTYTGLLPGTYTFSEQVPENWALTGITCTNSNVVIPGPELSVTIGPGESVVCTYHDTRTDPPPPNPPEPPTPPGPPTPGPPTPPTPPPTTSLKIVKTAPRTARVGQRVTFKLTVTNVGRVAAKKVLVADVPSATVALASLKSGRPARLVRGNAVWSVGTLAPGAKRTIRGSVLIKSGTPGLKRNLALAAGSNTKLARDRADTRLRARQAVAPVVSPLTG
ncbi:MAG TPA: VWA domain-containing protein [Thermoleophilaceae bacterium]|jgi:uncharacterized repeat protein (TIGR01451 family)